jgi:release factor glutamine methyltransferase
VIWTSSAVLEWTIKRFTEASIDGARLEAQVLLAHALGCTRMQLYTNFDRPLDEPELARARGLIKRRLAGEPLAYLVGTQEFWSLPFVVDPSVLIPRHDTETVVQVVLDHVDRKAPHRILDVCTGSGILAVTLAHELPAATVVAIDLSPPACAIAARNAELNHVADRVTVLTGDLLAPLAATDTFDIVVSNPPYIPSATISGLDREVQHEPRLALDGGADGLDLVRRLLAGLGPHLAPAFLVALEHGFDQHDAVAALLAPLVPPQLARDLARHPRVTWGQVRPAAAPA